MTERQRISIKSYPWRLWILRAVIAIFALVLVGRLFALQVNGHQYYATLAANQHNFSSILTPERGDIYIQNGENNAAKDGATAFYPVAVNKKVDNLVISPHDITDDQATTEKIVQLAGLNSSDVSDAIKNKDKHYVVLKKDLSDEESKAIGDAKLKGVWLETEEKRYYPEGDFLSQVLGFVGFTDGSDAKAGTYGLEKYFNDVLSGTPGNVDAAYDPTGGMILGNSSKLTPAKPGSSLVLTIDHSIQAEAEKELKETVQQFGAESGTVLVGDPRTGAILAMASAPSFDPNNYNQAKDPQVFNNLTVQSRYELGSVIKPLTMAAGLQLGKVQPDDTYVDAGSVKVGDVTIRNAETEIFGTQTMTQVLEKSLNTGIVWVLQKIGKDALYKYFHDFGLGDKTGITLPGEVAGNLRNLEDKRNDVNYATASFGQGISMTTLELLQAYQTIANGGVMMKPFLVSEIDHPDGSREVVQPQEVRRVLSEDAAAKLSSMLVDVVENGTGKRAKQAGFYIAGKTGTAQVPKENGSGYDPNKNIGTFVGFGPVENPRFVMVFEINNPKGLQFAESSTGPAFGRITKFILDYYQVAPTRPTQ